MRNLILLLLASFIFTNGCSKSYTKKQPGEFWIVSTLLPIHDIVFSLSRDIPGVISFALFSDAPVNPHYASLKPGDMNLLEQADLVLRIGNQIDQKFDKKLLDNIQGDDNYELLSLTDYVNINNNHSSVSITNNNLLEFDPHLWMSLSYMISTTEILSEKLCGISPDYTTLIKAREQALLSELRNLHFEFNNIAEYASYPTIVTHHNAFYWFCADTGFRLSNVVERSHGGEPKPRELNELLQQLRENPPAAIFIEPHMHTDITLFIGRELGIPVRVLDPCVNGPWTENFYISKMKSNLNVLNELFGKPK